LKNGARGPAVRRSRRLREASGGGARTVPTPAAAAAAAAAATPPPHRASCVAAVRSETRKRVTGADGYADDQFLCSRSRRPTGT